MKPLFFKGICYTIKNGKAPVVSYYMINSNINKPVEEIYEILKHTFLYTEIRNFEVRKNIIIKNNMELQLFKEPLAIIYRSKNIKTSEKTFEEAYNTFMNSHYERFHNLKTETLVKIYQFHKVDNIKIILEKRNYFSSNDSTKIFNSGNTDLNDIKSNNSKLNYNANIKLSNDLNNTKLNDSLDIKISNALNDSLDNKIGNDLNNSLDIKISNALNNSKLNYNADIKLSNDLNDSLDNKIGNALNNSKLNDSLDNKHKGKHDNKLSNDLNNSKLNDSLDNKISNDLNNSKLNYNANNKLNGSLDKGKLNYNANINKISNDLNNSKININKLNYDTYTSILKYNINNNNTIEDMIPTPLEQIPNIKTECNDKTISDEKDEFLHKIHTIKELNDLKKICRKKNKSSDSIEILDVRDISIEIEEPKPKLKKKIIQPNPYSVYVNPIKTNGIYNFIREDRDFNKNLIKDELNNKFKHVVDQRVVDDDLIIQETKSDITVNKIKKRKRSAFFRGIKK